MIEDVVRSGVDKARWGDKKMTEGWPIEWKSLISLYTQPAVESRTMTHSLPCTSRVTYEGVLCKPKVTSSESSRAQRGDALLLSRSHVSVASGGESCQGLRPIGWPDIGPV
jgi:hypothetical protein